SGSDAAFGRIARIVARPSRGRRRSSACGGDLVSVRLAAPRLGNRFAGGTGTCRGKTLRPSLLATNHASGVVFAHPADGMDLGASWRAAGVELALKRSDGAVRPGAMGRS